MIDEDETVGLSEGVLTTGVYNDVDENLPLAPSE